MEYKGMTNSMDYIIIISIPKKDDFKKCSQYCTISLISQKSKILRVILNRLTPQSEQVGFRKNRSTIEHILNCRLMDKHTDQ